MKAKIKKLSSVSRSSLFVKELQITMFSFFVPLSFIFALFLYPSLSYSQTKRIEGQPLGITPEKLFLDVGEKDGVKEGMEFEIIRDGKVIGIGVIIEVQENSSVLKLEPGIDVDWNDKIVEKIERKKKEEVTPSSEPKEGEKKEVTPKKNKGEASKGEKKNLTTKENVVKKEKKVKVKKIKKKIGYHPEEELYYGRYNYEYLHLYY